jgi:hypothetical protein
MAMKERTRSPESAAKTPLYSPEMTDAEIAALIARLHRNAAARTHPDPLIADSVEVVRQMRAERETASTAFIDVMARKRDGKI